MSAAVTVAEIENYLRERIATDLELEPGSFQVDSDLTDLGLSSVVISFIEGDVEAWLGVEIPPALLFQTSTIRDAARAIHGLQRPAESAAATLAAIA
jgi:acyl carrier protein